MLSSVTGGDRKIEVPADKINLDFVVGNKVMVGTVNANREYFEMGVFPSKSLALTTLKRGNKNPRRSEWWLGEDGNG